MLPAEFTLALTLATLAALTSVMKLAMDVPDNVTVTKVDSAD